MRHRGFEVELECGSVSLPAYADMMDGPTIDAEDAVVGAEFVRISRDERDADCRCLLFRGEDSEEDVHDGQHLLDVSA